MLILEDNLFLRPRIEHSLNAAQFATVFVASAERMNRAIAEHGDSIVALLANFGSRQIDFDTLIPAARDALGAAVPIVAYGPHVDASLRTRAEQLGCTELVPNGLIAKGASRVVDTHLQAKKAGS